MRSDFSYWVDAQNHRGFKCTQIFLIGWMLRIIEVLDALRFFLLGGCSES